MLLYIYIYMLFSHFTHRVLYFNSNGEMLKIFFLINYAKIKFIFKILEIVYTLFV